MPGSNIPRDIQNYTKIVERNVDEKYEKLSIISFTGILSITKDYEPETLKIYSPKNSPLEMFFNENQDMVEKIKKICEEMLLNKFGVPLVENTRQNVVDEPTEIKKPPYPISILTHDQICAYFPGFITSVYKAKNLKIKKTNGL